MTEAVTLDIPPSEMLPEYSPPPVCFVIVMPQIQTEPLSELNHTETLLKVLKGGSLPSEVPKVSKSQTRPSKRVAKDTAMTFPSYSPRRLFTDNWNSFWHVAFGVIAVKLQLFVPLFIFYQFLDLTDVNVFVDIIEFLCGYILGSVFNWI
jgi:hypothetical protein